LVIKGYQLTDFRKTYASISNLTTFILQTSPVVKSGGWTVDHLDVITAILNPEIDNDNIFMELPDFWPLAGRIVPLNSTLYGLKQALWLWHKHINTLLLSLDFTQSEAYPSLYIGEDILLLLFVDNI
jgi:hypothetical protein